MEGIVLSYTKILKEIKEIKEKIEEMSQKDKNPRKKQASKGEVSASLEGPKVKTKTISNKAGSHTSTMSTLANPTEGIGISMSDFFKNLEESI